MWGVVGGGACISLPTSAWEELCQSESKGVTPVPGHREAAEEQMWATRASVLPPVLAKLQRTCNFVCKIYSKPSNYPSPPSRVPKGADITALSRQCENYYHFYTQAFMQRVNHMPWGGGVDTCFSISTEKRGCSWLGTAIQPNSFRGRGFANIFWS